VANPALGGTWNPVHVDDVTRHTERRYGTYIHEALRWHEGHSLTVHPGPLEVGLYCKDCGVTVISAGSNGRWRGEYRVPGCSA
jgi:hypothetical protein